MHEGDQPFTRVGMRCQSGGSHIYHHQEAQPEKVADAGEGNGREAHMSAHHAMMKHTR